MDHGLSAERLEETERRLEQELRALGVREPGTLAAEATAVVDALTAAAAPSASSVDKNEALALAALLGRRISATGAAVGTALLLVDGVDRARGAAGKIDVGALRGAVIEGFVQGLREAVEAEVEERVVARTELSVLAPGLFLAVLPAVDDADRMATAMDALGRTLLKRDAKACVVWLPGPIEARDEAVLSGLAALVENVRMIGAKVAIAAGDPEARRKIAERLDGSVPTAPDLEGALEALGHALGQTNVLRRWLGNR